MFGTYQDAINILLKMLNDYETHNVESGYKHDESCNALRHAISVLTEAEDEAMAEHASVFSGITNYHF